MISKYFFSVALFVALTLPVFSQVSNDNEDEVNKIDCRFAAQDYVPGQVLVKFSDTNRISIRRARGKFSSTNVSKVTTVLQKYGTDEMERLLPQREPKHSLAKARAYNGATIQEHDLSQLYCLKLAEEHQFEVKQMVDELKSLDEVEFAEPNYRVYAMADTHIADSYSNNPMESQQWYLDKYGVKELWNKPVINKDRPIIAILDTGVDLTHPDLKDNLWTNTVEEYGLMDNDNDGNGFKNDVHGYDFVNNTSNIRDNNMHGTHVAGIAAAANNGIGIIGANPQALIMPVTVLQSDGTGDLGTIIKGIDYAVQNGATIINMSLGVYSNSSLLREALENAYTKAVLVAAAGNNALSVCPEHKRPHSYCSPCFPAAYSFVLGIQASDVFGEMTDWSNYDDDGPVYACNPSLADPDGLNYELMAPGRNMLSTVPGGKYKSMSGTSMAAPLVSGAISALMMVKQYDNQEVLWADIIHSKNIAGAYNLDNRPAELDFQRIIIQDRKELGDLSEDDYSNDNEIDVGETVSLYPVIRNTFGSANNIMLRLALDDFEDPDVVEIIKSEAFFGSLDAYGKGVSPNPLVIKVPTGTADGRHIRLKLTATCDELSTPQEFPLTIVSHNMVKIKGLISEDMTLSANHVYYVNGTIGIDKGCTLTIEPGTRLEFAAGTQIKSFGKLVANGTKEKPIEFARHVGEGTWNGIYTHQNESGHVYNDEWICTNSDSTLFTLIPTAATPVELNKIERRVFYGANDVEPTRYFTLKDYLGEVYTDVLNMTGKEDLLTDPNFITPAMLRMLKDFNDYCSQYSSKSTADRNKSKNVTAKFIRWCTIDNPRDTISFCKIEDCTYDSDYPPYMKDCVLKRLGTAYVISDDGERNVVMDSKLDLYITSDQIYSNYVNNWIGSGEYNKYSNMKKLNYFNNFTNNSNGQVYSVLYKSTDVSVDHAEFPSYLGTGREDLIRPYIFELGNGKGSWGVEDLSNMRKEPYSEAHGIVWKILVNGKDAQDEYEELAPLGVGRHKFEIYFNRRMNKAAIPQVSFGLRSPFTQHSVDEDGMWNDEGTIYTVYKTITAKTQSDGLNRIYVWGAEDDEFVECPYEKTRFNITIQVAGSLSTGLVAESGLGCVNLNWNANNENLEDAMGFNVYRYEEIYATVPAGWRNGVWHDTETTVVNDTICLNPEILDIETSTFTDYDVKPGGTYYYFYKVLSTDLQEFNTSNVVAATVKTSSRGDANGSGTVDVADVVTTVNYITKLNPKPFVFEAADMNRDLVIDILDVVEIVKCILNQASLASSMAESTATYSIEDGILYVESNVSLGGVQAQLIVNEDQDIKSSEHLDGFEQASAWLSDNDFIFLAYSLNGKTLNPGKYPLLYVGDAELSGLRLSDLSGRNILAVNDNNMTEITNVGRNIVAGKGIYDLYGRKIDGGRALNENIPSGIYIVNGKKVVK